MGTQNLGTLYVRLNADSKALLKGFASATAAVEKFAKETKKLANDIAQVGGALLLMGGAAMKLAASVDRGAARSMDNLERSTKLLAVQVADVLRPAVDSLAQSFRTAADYFAGLDPETKKQIASWAVLVAQFAVAAKAIGMVSGLVSGLAGAFSAASGAIAAIGVGGLLNIIAVIAALAVAVVVLHRAWRKNWGGIQEKVKAVAETIVDLFRWMGNGLKTAWEFAVDSVIDNIELLVKALDKLQKFAGVHLFNAGGITEGLEGLRQDAKSGNFLAEGLKYAKSIASEAADTFTEEIKIIGEEIRNAMNISLPTKGEARQPSGTGPATTGGIFAPIDASTTGTMMFFQKMNEHVEQASIVTDSMAEKLSMTAGRAAVLEAEMKKSAAAAAKFRAAVATMRNTLVSATGTVGQVFSNIAQAAGQGGPWAAVFAAIMEVVQRMASFQKLLRILEYGLTRLGQFLEPLLSGLFDALGQITALATEQLGPLFAALKPLFDGITQVVQGLIPTIAQLGPIFSALAPVLETIAKVVGGLLKGLQPLLDIGTFSLKVFATALLGFLIMLNEIAAAFGDTNARAEADRLKGMVDAMWSPDADERARADAAAAAAAWDVASANESAAKSANELAESLYNVPSGYKGIANARFNATAPGQRGSYDDVTQSGMAASAGGGTTINGDVYVQSDASSVEELADDIKKERARERSRRSGNPVDPRDL